MMKKILILPFLFLTACKGECLYSQEYTGVVVSIEIIAETVPYYVKGNQVDYFTYIKIIRDKDNTMCIVKGNKYQLLKVGDKVRGPL